MYRGQCLQIPSLVRDYSRSFLKTKAVKTNICRYRKEKTTIFHTLFTVKLDNDVD